MKPLEFIGDNLPAFLIGGIVLLLGVIGADCACAHNVDDRGVVISKLFEPGYYSTSTDSKGQVSSTWHPETYRLGVQTEQHGSVSFETSSDTYMRVKEGEPYDFEWREGRFMVYGGGLR